MDSELDKAVAGSADARDQLARRYEERLLAFIRRRAGERLRRECSPEDLCQETFLDVFRSLHTLGFGAPTEAFERRLMRSADWTVRRRGARSRDFAGQSAAGDWAPGEIAPRHPSTGPVTQRELTEWVMRLADRLGPKYGEILRRRLHGRSFTDIARDLGESEEAVRKRYTRAREALRLAVERSRRP